MKNIDRKSKESFEENGANFESAILAVGYGKFHYILFLILIPAIWSSFFDTSNIFMILQAAECDLELILFQKEILNAAVYAGMVTSAFIWGFIADVLGRRKVLIYGFIFDGVCNVLNGFSPNFAVLVFFKYMSGFILAWLIPQSWLLVFGDGVFIYNSWRIYLSLCGLPIIFSGLCLFFFSESPKFLLSKGHNERALKVLRRIYAINSGFPSESYPVNLFLIRKFIPVFSI